MSCQHLTSRLNQSLNKKHAASQGPPEVEMDHVESTLVTLKPSFSQALIMALQVMVSGLTPGIPPILAEWSAGAGHNLPDVIM